MSKRGFATAVVVLTVAVVAFAVPVLAEEVTFAGARLDADAVPAVPPAASVVNPPEDAPEPSAYGTTLWSVYNAGPCDTADRQVAGTPYLSNCQYVGTTGGVGTYVGFPIHIPTGASVQYARIYFNQTVIGDTIGAGLWKADMWGNTTTPVVMTPTATTGGDTVQQWGPFTEVIDNSPTGGYQYYFLAYIPGATRLYKMMIYYKLAVSAGPATATFTDVPTTSGQFNYVEALVAAGITSGCGTGLYCPDTPVTRGQMAVFLARALGLSYQY